MAKYASRYMDGKSEDYCEQELGEHSISMFDEVTFDELIELIKKEKKIYQKYLVDSHEIRDSYLEGKCSKLVKFDEIKLSCDYWREKPTLRIMGRRKLDEVEKKLKNQEVQDAQDKQLKERKAQYEKLKQEFGS